jgi:hypothetical protein
MRGAIPPLPQYVFMAWCLVKHRDNFTLLSCIATEYNFQRPWVRLSNNGKISVPANIYGDSKPCNIGALRVTAVHHPDLYADRFHSTSEPLGNIGSTCINVR